MIKKLGLILLFCLGLFGQSSNNLFRKGENFYNDGQYWQALKIFNELSLQDTSLNHQISASEYMVAKCHFNLGNKKRAIQKSRQFEYRHKNDSYLDDIHLLLGDIYFALKDYNESAWNYALASSESDDVLVQKNARDLAINVVSNYANETELRQIGNRSASPAGQLLTLLVAERCYADGNFNDAFNYLYDLRPLLENPYLIQRTKHLDGNFRFNRPDTLHFGVILPLTGSMGRIGNDILNGIKYSSMLFVDSTQIQIKLYIRDNELDLAKTIRISREFAHNQKINAIIGPLANENVKGAAAVLDGTNKLFISPTATEEDLTTLTDGFYQFQSNRKVRAYALAEYAVNVMNKKRFVIIAPSDEYGRQYANNFVDRLHELGAEITYQGWYSGEPTDLSKNFRRIRQLAFNLLDEKIRVDSLQHFMDIDSLLELQNLGYDVDTLITQLAEVDYYEPYKDQLNPITKKVSPRYTDSLKVSLDNIDAFFFPIHKGDIRYLASQLAHFNLTGLVLGDENWKDEPLLRKYYTYLPELAIVSGESDYLRDDSEKVFSYFKQLYDSEPETYSFLGFDVMSTLLNNIQYLGSKSNGWKEIFSVLPEFKGQKYRVYWGGVTQRENQSAFMFELRNQKLIPAGFRDPDGFQGLIHEKAEVDSILLDGYLPENEE